MPRAGKKRLTVDLPQDMHRILKSIATLRNVSMTTLIFRQIYKIIKEQEQLDKEK